MNNEWNASHRQEHCECRFKSKIPGQNLWDKKDRKLKDTKQKDRSLKTTWKNKRITKELKFKKVNTIQRVARNDSKVSKERPQVNAQGNQKQKE